MQNDPRFSRSRRSDLASRIKQCFYIEESAKSLRSGRRFGMRALVMCIGAAFVVGAPPASRSCGMERAEAIAGTIAYRDCGQGKPVIVIPGGPGLDADYIA